MLKISSIALLSFLVALPGCGQKEEKSKVEEAVKEAVTKEFKMYEGAKAALEKADKESKERVAKEAK